jgi:dipeptide/tripeptide permease
MFYPALATIAIGNGFFPAPAEPVGNFYAPGDPRGTGVQRALRRHQPGCRACR